MRIGQLINVGRSTSQVRGVDVRKLGTLLDSEQTQDHTYGGSQAYNSLEGNKSMRNRLEKLDRERRMNGNSSMDRLVKADRLSADVNRRNRKLKASEYSN